MRFNFPLFRDLQELNKNRYALLGIFVVILILLLIKNMYNRIFGCIREEPKGDLFEKNIEKWHEKRREKILKKYPEVKELEKQNFIYGILDTCCLFLLIAIKFWIIYKLIYCWKFHIGFKTLIALVIIPYFSISIAQYTHEFGHHTVFQSEKVNQAWLLVTDLIYYFGTAFSTYSYMHSFHHDVEASGTEKDIIAIPYQCEEDIIQNKWYMKVFYQSFFPYRIPVIYKKIFKKPIKLPFWLGVLNVIKIILMVLFIPKFLILHYLTELLQFYHPLYSSISEHIQLTQGRMTNSFYGNIINKLTHNLYYHTEHHDFSKINSRYHPKLRKIAPEFYPDTGYHKIPLYFKILFSPKFTLTRKLD